MLAIKALGMLMSQSSREKFMNMILLETIHLLERLRLDESATHRATEDASDLKNAWFESFVFYIPLVPLVSHNIFRKISKVPE